MITDFPGKLQIAVRAISSERARILDDRGLAQLKKRCGSLAGKIDTNIAGGSLSNAADNDTSSKHQTTEPGILLCLISFSARNQSSSGEPFDLSLSVQI